MLFRSPFTKMHICKCSHCSTVSISRIKKKYCSVCSDLYSPNSRNRFKFTFNVFKFPDLFDTKLLSSIGFYSPGGKSGKWNPNGLSRDHRVSVNESILNNYDPFYITHPLNCELMTQEENNKKKTNSSISYAELVSIVDKYESLK